MTDDADRAARAAKVAALAQWAGAVSAATREFRNEIARVDQSVLGLTQEEYWGHLQLPIDDEFQHVVEIASSLTTQASLIAGDPEFDHLHRRDELPAAKLRGARNRMRSSVYGNATAAIPLAAQILEQMVKFIEWSALSSEDAASALIGELASRVHPGFHALHRQVAEIEALMLRFERDPNRRRTRAGIPSKLGADGILARLNEMAGGLLGESGKLTANAIAAARARNRDTP